MELLKEIRDGELPQDESSLKTREASRIVLFDENGMVPMLFVSRYSYHKLPGGGIDEGEDRKGALVREVLEETGSRIEIKGEIGKVIEFRSEWSLKQISYCYIGRVVSKGEPDFTEKELRQGFELVWMTLDEAISRMENDKPACYEGNFIRKRDLVFLKRVRLMKGSGQPAGE